MNILQQYKKAVTERGGSGPVEIKTQGRIQVGGTFEFGGYFSQRVGDRVVLSDGRTQYGYAEIISVDPYGFKMARRTK